MLILVVDLHQMSELSDTPFTYYTNVSSITHLPGMFLARAFFKNIGIESLLGNSLVLCLHPNKDII